MYKKGTVKSRYEKQLYGSAHENANGHHFSDLIRLNEWPFASNNKLVK